MVSHIVLLYRAPKWGPEIRAWYRLSAAFNANANTPGKKYADGGGLWLAVRKTGTRHWLFRCQRDGIARAMGMGSLRSTSLAAGVDPINDRIGARPQASCAPSRALPPAPWNF